MVNNQEIEEGRITCRQTIEGGTVTFEADLPMLFTTQRGLNEPRYASLPGIMKAKKKPLATKTLADLGVDAADLQPATTTAALQTPPERQGGRIVEGESAADKAAELVRLLNEEAKVL